MFGGYFQTSYYEWLVVRLFCALSRSFTMAIALISSQKIGEIGVEGRAKASALISSIIF